jgi:hypothetical protein
MISTTIRSALVALLVTATVTLTSCAPPPPPPPPPTVTAGATSLACDGKFTARFTVKNNFSRSFRFRFTSAGNVNVDAGATPSPGSATIAAGATARVVVTGKVTNPCLAATVNLEASTPGLPAGSGAATVGALAATATWPATATAAPDRSFSYTIVVTCCPAPAPVTVSLTDSGSTGVESLRVNPSSVRCPGGPHNVVVSGKLKKNVEQGIVTIGMRSGTGQECLMKTTVR